jgi:hypothetical protein
MSFYFLIKNERAHAATKPQLKRFKIEYFEQRLKHESRGMIWLAADHGIP